MIIDWQHHLATQKFVELAKRPDQEHLAKWTMDIQMKDMTEAGVDISCLSGNAQNIKEARLFDDEISKWVNAHPDRFTGFAHFPPTGGQEAIDELDRAVKDLGFRACHVRALNYQPNEESAKDSVLLDDQVLYPFYKKAVDLDIPIFIHPSYFTLVPSAFPEPLRTRLKTFSMGAISREIDMMMQLVRIVDGGVLEKFPNLKIVVAHLGGGISADFNRMWDYSTWGTNTQEEQKEKEKRQKFFRKLYIDLGGIYGDVGHLKLALTKTTPNRILFGTDYPMEVQNPKFIARFIKEIRALDISEKDKQLILGENAAALLKIKV